jgi:hypothetical protein
VAWVIIEGVAKSDASVSKMFCITTPLLGVGVDTFFPSAEKQEREIKKLKKTKKYSKFFRKAI